MKIFYTGRQIAKKMGVSPTIICRMIKGGRLTPEGKSAGGYVFDGDKIDKIIDFIGKNYKRPVGRPKKVVLPKKQT